MRLPSCSRALRSSGWNITSRAVTAMVVVFSNIHNITVRWNTAANTTNIRITSRPFNRFHALVFLIHTRISYTRKEIITISRIFPSDILGNRVSHDDICSSISAMLSPPCNQSFSLIHVSLPCAAFSGTYFLYLYIRCAHVHLGHCLHVIIIIVIFKLDIFRPGIIHCDDKKIVHHCNQG